LKSIAWGKVLLRASAQGKPMQVYFCYSDNAIKDHYIATGEKLPAQNAIEYDPTELTPGQRASIYGCESIKSHEHKFDYPCAIEDIFNYLASKREKEAERLDLEIAKAIELIQGIETRSETELVDILSSYHTINYQRIPEVYGYDKARRTIFLNLENRSVGAGFKEKLKSIDIRIESAKVILSDRIKLANAKREEQEERAKLAKQQKVEAQKVERSEWIARMSTAVCPSASQARTP
jgi:hypothetical protein